MRIVIGIEDVTSMRWGAAASPRTEPVYMPEYTSASDLDRS